MIEALKRCNMNAEAALNHLLEKSMYLPLCVRVCVCVFMCACVCLQLCVYTWSPYITDDTTDLHLASNMHLFQ